MDKDTFKYSLQLTRDPFLLVNQVDNMGKVIVEVWILDREDRENRHLVETISVDYEESPTNSSVLKKIKIYNSWFNEFTNRPQVNFEV